MSNYACIEKIKQTILTTHMEQRPQLETLVNENELAQWDMSLCNDRRLDRISSSIGSRLADNLLLQETTTPDSHIKVEFKRFDGKDERLSLVVSYTDETRAESIRSKDTFLFIPEEDATQDLGTKTDQELTLTDLVYRTVTKLNERYGGTTELTRDAASTLEHNILSDIETISERMSPNHITLQLTGPESTKMDDYVKIKCRLQDAKTASDRSSQQGIKYKDLEFLYASHLDLIMISETNTKG